MNTPPWGKIPRFFIAIDGSGGMPVIMIDSIKAEIPKIVGNLKKFTMIVASFDSRVIPGSVAFYDQTNINTLKDYNIWGGGGTFFTPIFDFIEKFGITVDETIIFTDGYGADISELRNYQNLKYGVTWVLTHGENMPYLLPFGELFNLEILT